MFRPDFPHQKRVTSAGLGASLGKVGTAPQKIFVSRSERRVILVIRRAKSSLLFIRSRLMNLFICYMSTNNFNFCDEPTGLCMPNKRTLHTASGLQRNHWIAIR